MKITEHFKLEEFVHGSIEAVPANVKANIEKLCFNYLEPLRLCFGPIIINSGYRTELENSCCGGAKNSYHLKGLAADIRCKDVDDAIEKAAWLIRRDSEFMINTNHFAELIISNNSKGSWWVHFALRRDMTDHKRLVKFEHYG